MGAADRRAFRLFERCGGVFRGIAIDGGRQQIGARAKVSKRLATARILGQQRVEPFPLRHAEFAFQVTNRQFDNRVARIVPVVGWGDWVTHRGSPVLWRKPFSSQCNRPTCDERG